MYGDDNCHFFYFYIEPLGRKFHFYWDLHSAQIQEHEEVNREKMKIKKLIVSFIFKFNLHNSPQTI